VADKTQVELDAELATKQRILDLEKQINKERGKGGDAARTTGEVVAGNLEKLKSQAALYDKMGDSYDARVIQQQQAIAIAQEELKIANDKIAKGEIQGEAALELKRTHEENLKIAKNQLEVLQNTTEAIKEARKAAKGLGGALGGAISQYGQHQFFNTENLMNLGKAFRGGEKSIVPFIKSMGTAVIGGFINSLISLMFQVNDAESAFKRTAGASDEMARQMTKNWEETRIYGVELKEMTATMTELKSTYTDFTMLNADAQKEVSKTGALLGEVGYKATDFAKGMQIATKAFGQTADSAAAAQRDLADFANVIGVVPEQMGADFAAMGGSLAKMGDQGIRAFKDLAIVSKTTGLEMKKLLAITDKFDTFEGAATQAGKLNAALGGNFVNAMDLMTATDPAERFGMIRDSILDTGLTFDNMSYYQRKFYTDALGLDDVSDLAAVLSGDMSNLAGATRKSSADYAKLAQRTKDIQSITEKFKNLMADMIPTMTEVIDNVDKWYHSLSKEDIKAMKKSFKQFAYALVEIGKALIFVVKHWYIFGPLLALLKFGPAIGGALKFTKGLFGMGKAAEKVGGTVADKLGEGISSVVEKTTDSMADGIENVGQKAEKSAGGILALGGAVLMIGAGIAIAALGVAELVKSFSGLGDAAPWAALGLGLFMLGMVAMVALLLYFAPAIIGATGVLLAFGGAVLLVGLGVGIAAVGIGMMAEGFAVMFTAIEVDKLLAFAAFIATIGMMAPLLAVAAVAMTVLTVSFAALGLAMAMFPTSDLIEFTEFFNSIGALEAMHLIAIADGIHKINTELEKMPEKKAMALQATMEMAATQQVAGAIAGTAGAVADAITGVFGGGKEDKGVNVKVDVGDVLLDGDVVGKFVKKTMGEVARDSVRGTA